MKSIIVLPRSLPEGFAEDGIDHPVRAEDAEVLTHLAQAPSVQTRPQKCMMSGRTRALTLLPGFLAVAEGEELPLIDGFLEEIEALALGRIEPPTADIEGGLARPLRQRFGQDGLDLDERFRCRLRRFDPGKGPAMRRPRTTCLDLRLGETSVAEHHSPTA